MSIMDLKGKTAIVTGGSQGLGEALCLRLDREGCNVVVCDINLSGAQSVASKCKNDALALKTDVTDFNRCNETMQEIVSRFKKIDILVCNAAVLKKRRHI